MKRIVCLVIALMMALSLAACGDAQKSGVEDGVLTVGMECAYAPYNWMQTDDSNGAVPIANVPGAYANGYDVMMAKRICEANGWQLEVKKLDWDSLVPAVQTGEIDCAIAGQSMTAERDELVDFAGPYIYASIVCLTTNDSELASATGISQLTGTCTSQRGTIWYDTCLPQIQGADIQPAADDAGAMLLAASSGTCDFVCTDMPTAQGAVITYPNLTILDFSGSEDDFEVSAEEINIGISVREGNKTLLDAMNKVLDPMNADDFNALMAQAVAVQPIEE
ncbi:MAG: transporter substrate-binding domain-containing protein [Oscillospiraceae bacterium]|nr:transporter substrate-binding domain-containing protein [Oscillospiraceae bacterium]